MPARFVIESVPRAVSADGQVEGRELSTSARAPRMSVRFHQLGCPPIVAFLDGLDAILCLRTMDPWSVRLHPRTIDAVKEADIVDVVGEHVVLKKKGRSLSVPVRSMTTQALDCVPEQFLLLLLWCRRQLDQIPDGVSASELQ